MNPTGGSLFIDSFIENAAGLDFAIKTCIEARVILPALVLIYAGMDIVASIEHLPGDRVGQSFTSWVEHYALKAHPLPCTSTELYSARCGILHTLTPESDLVRAGKARRIVYAWGSADAHDLQETADRMVRSDIVVLHVEDLRWAFIEGTKLWFQEIHTDTARLSSMEATLSLWFVNVSKDIVAQYLRSTDPKPTI
jgi:hypothetical protein